jgi:hypothetical protein
MSATFDYYSIATTLLKHASPFKRHAQYGMVMVNLPTTGVVYHGPFGEPMWRRRPPHRHVRTGLA